MDDENTNVNEQNGFESDYEDQVNQEVETQEEQSARQRLEKIEKAFGKDTLDEALWDSENPDTPYQKPQKNWHEMDEADVDLMDEEQLVDVAKKSLKTAVHQVRDEKSKLNKEVKVAQKIIQNEFPELAPNPEKNDAGKFPFILSHYQRVNAELPNASFEDKIRIAGERTIDYLGMREQVKRARLSTYADNWLKHQNNIKKTFRNSPQQGK